MNEATLVEAFRGIPRRDSVRIGAQIGKLRKVCLGDQALEAFFPESLDILLRLFNAPAGAFWFRPFNAATLFPVSRVGFEQLTLSSSCLSACEQMVRGAWQALGPQVRPIDHPFVALIGPIRDGSTSIGALQLVADGGDEAAQQAKLPYARALAGVLSLIQPAIHRRMQVGETSIREATDRLAELADQLTGLQQSMRHAIDQTLGQLRGASFGSLEANQQFARVIQELLDTHGLRVECPECGTPAILRCSKNPRARDGVFVFDHSLAGRRTFHGGYTTLPVLQVVSKPPRRGKTLA
ncbi:hypothetical protein Poly24_14340 [Rosistilla carotiformis]|uniref:Uncharacterized protein n=1 Tax=Rosistilla carotiformis TaxID=2528017 RepID=A0A518JQA9_9BACT|nr:hypothetical protein [Rosistilla carotiformis]QDV67730.1 hypothetical protein Poly24_14340 [Rosistilla carotiformis]